MNITIVTPGRSGSSLLQRTLTVFMNKEKNTQPAVNIYDLGEGNIVKNYSDAWILSRISKFLLEPVTIESILSIWLMSKDVIR